MGAAPPAATLAPSSGINLRSATFTIVDAFEKGFTDFQFFAEVALPDVMRFKFPPLYIAIWLMLVKAHTAEERARVIRFALGLPRGFAKTTFIKVLICWLICYDKVSFVLTVCATEPHARNFIADLNDILASPNMEKVYGAWTVNLALDQQELKKCSYRRRLVIIAAIGSGTSVRGLNIGHERPDFIICDDMQTKENADSDAESMRLLQWFIGTLLKAVDPLRSMVVYIGNMYPLNCILYKLKENPYWTSLITGAILADGGSLWEELRSLDSLYEEYKHDENLGLAFIWFAEMMNDPIVGQISLLPSGTIPTCPLRVEEIIPNAGFIVIDPAGFKRAADDNVVAAFLVQEQVPYQVALSAGTYTPLKVIEEAVRIALLFNIRVIFIESVAYQQTLKFWFEHIVEKVGLKEHFVVVEITPKGKNKDNRIRVSIHQLLDKTWYIADPDARQRYMFQALSYKVGKTTNRDDILDADAYIEDIRNDEHWALIHSLPMNAPEDLQAGVIANNTPF